MWGQAPSVVRRPGSSGPQQSYRDRRVFHSCAFISTLRPRNRTPSASNRRRCSMAESPVSLIAPPDPSTRCQGSPNPRRNTRATIRAAPGYPAARATPPYVDTFPRGIPRITRSMRNTIIPGTTVFFFDFLMRAKGRQKAGLYRISAPHFSLVLGEVGILIFFKSPDNQTTPQSGTLPAPRTPNYALRTR